jgi:hypothetical protein
MNDARKKLIFFILALALMAGTVGALKVLKSHQRLGAPGLIAETIPGSTMVKLALPERVLDFDSTNLPTADVVLGYLPKDTSYAQRHYFATNGDWAMANVTLMGTDRTSIHRPDYCLPGQGWQINEKMEVKIPIAGTQPYTLPVYKWVVGKTVPGPDGKDQSISGIYVFWFVTDGEVTDDFAAMLKSMFFNLVHHGVLQRWAYVSYFSVCLPGREDATFARMKDLIAASVPEFQLPPATAK